MIRLGTMTERDRPMALELTPRVEQLRFVATMEEILHSLTPALSPVLVWHQRPDTSAIPVGFFLLDSQYHIEHSFAKADDLGFRAFFIDEQFQRRGFAQAALAVLPEFVQHVHPNTQRLVLTVNVKNHAAQALYLNGGFSDSGQLFQGGSAGPQHIFYRALPWSVGAT